MNTSIIFGDKKIFAVEVNHVTRSCGLVYVLLDNDMPNPVPQEREFLVGGVRIWVGGKYFGQIDDIVPLGIPAAQIERWTAPAHIPVCKNPKWLLKNMKLGWGMVAEKFRLRVELGETTDDFCISAFKSASHVWFYWMPRQWGGRPWYLYPRHLYSLNKGRVEFNFLCSVVREFMEWVDGMLLTNTSYSI